MGYHVTILRTEGRKRRPISGEELAAAAGTIPELRYDAAGPSVVDIREGETRARLILSDGELWTKNPDEGTLAVMIRLAEALGGRVRGTNSRPTGRPAIGTPIPTTGGRSGRRRA